MKRDMIYSLIDGDVETNKWSPVYDYFMMAVIIISLIPLAFKSKALVFDIIDVITVTVFISFA